MPKITPMTDIGCIFLPCNTRIINKTTKGCADTSRAAKPLSTYFKAQTTTPLPKVRNKKPAINVFLNCFLVIFKGSPKIFDSIKIKLPATTKRIPANIKAGNSVTAILFHKYVDPQMK